MTTRTKSSTHTGNARRIPRVIPDPTQRRNHRRQRRDHERALIRFARIALQTMQDQKDWSAETLDTIANHALSLGIATTEGDGSFKGASLPA